LMGIHLHVYTGLAPTRCTDCNQRIDFSWVAFHLDVLDDWYAYHPACADHVVAWMIEKAANDGKSDAYLEFLILQRALDALKVG